MHNAPRKFKSDVSFDFNVPPTTARRAPRGQHNFDGAAVNTSKWSMYNGLGHDGSGLRRPSAFSVANGLLTAMA